MPIELSISAGELIDRLTILELKLHRLPDAVRPELERELARVQAVRDRAFPPSERLLELSVRLGAVNAELWDLEEALRDCERTGSFDERFVELARRVYRTNDERAARKRQIDELVGSELREHKSHALPTLP